VTKEVNLWIEKETNGLIKKILPPCSVNNLTRIIFTNALYFKGKWDYPFEAWKTRNYDFHLLNGNSVKVPFMTSNDDQFISAFDGFKVLRLPYKQGEDKRQLSMYFFLPNARDGLAALVDKVASESELLHHKLPFKKVEVSNLKIPKFQFLFELETSDMLKQLGVILPFSPGAGGLTKMTDSIEESQNIYVSNIFHKSFIKVNEDGTEAVAAQASCLERECMCISSRLDFVADHPFLFLIREDSTQTILFMGQVLNPFVR
jgi:serpin B